METTNKKIAMIYVSIFALIVAVIAVVTNKLNAKTPCNHNWEENDGTVQCCNCGKKIPGYVTARANAYNNEAVTLRRAA